MINQARQGDGWLSVRRRSSSEVTSHIRRKISISRYDADGSNSNNPADDDRSDDELEADSVPQRSSEIPGAYAVARDNLSSQCSSEYSVGSINEDNDEGLSAAECVTISALPARSLEDDTELIANVVFDESGNSVPALQPKTWTTRHTKALALILVIICSIIAGTVAAVVLSTRPKATDTFIFVPPTEFNPCNSEVLDPVVQCLRCNRGVVGELSDGVYNAYHSLKNAAEFRGKLPNNLDIASCDPANIALVWVSLELQSGVLPPKGIFNRFVLVLLYASMEGERWITRDGWLTGSSECNWHGIGCDDSRDILSIKLPRSRVGGTLPTWLGMLRQLRIINFVKNEISGSIPSEIWTLSTLGAYLRGICLLSCFHPLTTAYASDETEHLSLSSNPAITGPIPHLSGFENLKKLDLGGTRLTGIFHLNELAKLSRLEVLDLSWTSTIQTGSQLNFLTELTSLKKLNLDGIFLSGSIPESIGNMSSLKHVSLSECGLSGSIPTSIGYLTYLTSFKLGVNSLEGSIPSHFGANTLLQELDVKENRQLGGTIPSELAKCIQLQTLSTEFTNISGTIPNEFSSLTSLQTFSIFCSNIEYTDSIINFCELGTTFMTHVNQFEFKNCPCCKTGNSGDQCALDSDADRPSC